MFASTYYSTCCRQTQLLFVACIGNTFSNTEMS